MRPRGTLVLKSTYAGKLTLDASALVVDEITMIGSRCGPFAKALELLTKEQVDVTSLTKKGRNPSSVAMGFLPQCNQIVGLSWLPTYCFSCSIVTPPHEATKYDGVHNTRLFE